MFSGRSRNRPKVFATSAAEDSGLANLPVSISLPGAAAKAARMRSAGRPGRKSEIAMTASFANVRAHSARNLTSATVSHYNGMLPGVIDP